MAKNTTLYQCSDCGKEYRSWSGRCSSCGGINTIEEYTPPSSNLGASSGLKTTDVSAPSTPARSLRDIGSDTVERFATGIEEFDRVTGGGLVTGEVVLMSGSPGAGKSTLSLRLAEAFASQGKKVLYSSGEESEAQIGIRAQRMGVSNDNILVIHEVSLEAVLGHIHDQKPDFVIVDSLQTIVSDGISGSIGSIQQSKEAANTLTRTAKSMGITMMLISQIVKSGDFAGSNQIAHIVDCALMLESDKESPLKFLRASKNRFGSSSEVGIFQHSATGLEEVANPGEILLQDTGTAGTAVTFYGDGTRQIPVETQALVIPSVGTTYPRRHFNGIQQTRGQIVCAIVDKFLKCGLDSKDVFLSTVAGVKIDDPLADLCVASAVYSAVKNISPPEKTAFIGEIGLTGYIRGNFTIDQKIAEARRLGFTSVVVPARSSYSQHKGISIVPLETIADLSTIIAGS